MAQSFRTDEEAEAVVEEYSLTVYRLAMAQLQNKSDADDVFQEVFLRYIRKNPSFESKEHEKAWFLRVTLNCCRNVWNSPFRKHTAALCEELPDERREESGIDEALSRLQKKDRALLHLFYYEDMATADIAMLLGRKESTVRMQLTRARRRLKELMEQEDAT